MDKLSEVFDVTPLPATQLPTAVISDGKVTSDSDFARENLRQLIATSDMALRNLLDVATQSDNPRVYEVLATLINAASDLNTKLIDIHQKERKMTVKTEEAVTKNVTNNVVFTGTTQELNQLIMKRMADK